MQSYAKKLAKALGLEGMLHIHPDNDCFEPGDRIYENRLHDLVDAYKDVPEASARLSAVLAGKAIVLGHLHQEVDDASENRSVGKEFCRGNIRFIVRVRPEDSPSLNLQELLRGPVIITGCQGFLSPDGGTYKFADIWIARAD